LIGAFLPLSLVATIRLARRAWAILLTAGLALALQYVATGIAALGFAILKPVSIIDQYVLLYPESTAAKAREFAALLGNNGLIGLHQAWTMLLAFPALVLVALIGNFAWVRRRPLLMAAAFSISMVLIAHALYGLTPALRDYPISGVDVALGALLALAGGLLTGALGLRLTRSFEPEERAQAHLSEEIGG
jgi:hypothetical protein